MKKLKEKKQNQNLKEENNKKEKMAGTAMNRLSQRQLDQHCLQNNMMTGSG